MKKRAYVKNQIRIISKTKARFLSIFCIVFLGAAFFAGLRQTPLIMQETMNHYYRQYNWSDLNYIGTLGFDQETISKVKNIKEVKQIDYGMRFDALMKYQDQTKGVTVYTSDHFDKGVSLPELTKGRLPKKDNEILLDAYLAKQKNISLNQKMTLESQYGKKEYRVVGLCNDTRYTCNFERGTNSLGDGNNSGFVLMKTVGNEMMALPQSLYDLYDGQVVYNDLRIQIKGSERYRIFTDQYDDFIKQVNKKIKKVLNQQYRSFYSQLVSDANDQLTDGKNAYENGLNQYLQGVSQYQQGKEQYEQGLKQYQDGYRQYQTGYNQYLSGLKQYQDGFNLFQEKKKEYQKGYQDYQTYSKQLSQYDQALQALNNQCGSYQNVVNQVNQLKEAIANPNLDQQTLQIYQAQLKQLEIAMASYEQLASQSQNIETLRAKLPTIKKTLDQSLQTINQTEKTFVEKKQQLEQAKIKLDTSKKTLDASKQQLDQAKKQLDESKIVLDQTNEQLNNAEKQLDQSGEQIKDIPQGKVVTLTKNENAAILSYKANCQSIESLSILFPMIFFLVAALVSLTTMTRMVEEQRVQSGTLRALGYDKKDVINQYLIYAFLATFFACGLGIVFGTYFFPGIIVYLYRIMMFDVGASTRIIFDALTCVETFAISVLITLVATFMVCMQELYEVPAQLLRPKAPKNGKRNLLERIGFIWKRLSFNQKVTMRNIFRYKKRFFMSVVGIAGCSALMVVGFGLKQSISPLASEQYQKMWVYDGVVNYDSHLNNEQLQQAQSDFKHFKHIKETMNIFDKTVSVGQQYATIEIPQNPKRFKDFIKMTSFETGKTLTLNNQGVMINAKLAELLDVKTGDQMTLTLNNKEYSVKIAGVYKLYFRHYVYMTPEYYKQITGEEVTYNSQYFTLDKDTHQSEKNLTYQVDHHQGMTSIQFVKGISESFITQMESINSVVFILIVCAGALAFIVLYNLTNINIQERKSEIATIKVLGFYPKEVYDYVFRENTILSLIGSLLGLYLGKLIHNYLIKTVEVDMAMFIRSVHFTSYIYAMILTFIFTFFIDFVMRKVLKNIDMVESLKSIE